MKENGDVLNLPQFDGYFKSATLSLKEENEILKKAAATMVGWIGLKVPEVRQTGR